MIPALKALVPARLQLAARYWYQSARRRLDDELPIALRLLRPGSIAIDAGANVGIYSYAFARRVRVEAFEPLPKPAAIMRASGPARSGRIRVHEVALSDSTGTASLRIPVVDGVVADQSASFTSSAVNDAHLTIPVRLRTLDSYDLRNVSLLKVDTEGHEAAVLRGAEALLGRERPALLIEIEQRHLSETPVAEVFEYIADRGYVGAFLENGQIHSLDRFRFETHQRPYIADPIVDPRYVNNFFFIAREDGTRRNLLGL
ncbi:MAG TPA: FkbM family methyltransferase [Gemmatimonadaceae bacterium]|jgi:FkbM family methyltransferase